MNSRASARPSSGPPEIVEVNLDHSTDTVGVVELMSAVTTVTAVSSATAPPDTLTTGVSGPASSSAVDGSPFKVGEATPESWEELATDRSPSRRGTSADLATCRLAALCWLSVRR